MDNDSDSTTAKVRTTPGASEEKIAHLGMIQGVINRLASNASTMKGLAATIAAAAIALYATNGASPGGFLLAAAVPVVVFWFLDTRYLHIERAYRDLYDGVRKGETVESFSMEYKPRLANVPSAFRLFFSWSVGLFYGVILATFGFIYLATFTVCAAPVAGN